MVRMSFHGEGYRSPRSSPSQSPYASPYGSPYASRSSSPGRGYNSVDKTVQRSGNVKRSSGHSRTANNLQYDNSTATNPPWLQERLAEQTMHEHAQKKKEIVYANGKVNNSSIVSTDSPDHFKSPFENSNLEDRRQRLQDRPPRPEQRKHMGNQHIQVSSDSPFSMDGPAEASHHTEKRFHSPPPSTSVADLGVAGGSDADGLENMGRRRHVQYQSGRVPSACAVSADAPHFFQQAGTTDNQGAQRSSGKRMGITHSSNEPRANSKKILGPDTAAHAASEDDTMAGAQRKAESRKRTDYACNNNFVSADSPTYLHQADSHNPDFYPAQAGKHDRSAHGSLGRSEFLDAKGQACTRKRTEIVYENGRVNNMSIVSTDAPDYFKGPFENSGGSLEYRRQVLQPNNSLPGATPVDSRMEGRKQQVVHDNGRVHNMSIVSQDAPDYFKQPFETAHDRGCFDDSHITRSAPKPDGRQERRRTDIMYEDGRQSSTHIVSRDMPEFFQKGNTTPQPRGQSPAHGRLQAPGSRVDAMASMTGGQQQVIRAAR